MQVWIREQKVLKYPQGLFVESAHGDGTAGSAGPAIEVLDRAALEIAARMLGSDRSRGYCLELICADFLAGAGLHLENEQDIRGEDPGPPPNPPTKPAK